ncbi:putative nuclease HARBI1 [Centruroides sculpturatus]|uniref:putative nuclease HARBI1 n=1 Tax=Centruroides sculpturatus TaxID=218467 RepID=UPI000C6D08F9|nr:putative nuclease HARBI1 [Centruroides sculpturatus]
MADGYAILIAIEELERAERRCLRRQRIFRPRVDAFVLHEEHFRRLFRLSKEVASNLINTLRPTLKEQTRRSALSVQTRILAAVRFFACGSYQLGIGQDFTLSISQKSVSRAIRSVSVAIRDNLLKHWILNYNNNNKLYIHFRFYDKYTFPGVIGAIDCCHVAIVSPPVEDINYPEHIYVNRKGYHSLNVQLICDANMYIMNVNARFPGSVHDAFIWKNSNVRKAFQRWHNCNRNAHTWLLGDSGYPLEPWLLTPLRTTNTQAEVKYNNCLTATRSIIEQCNGLLKNRWRCLLKHRVLHYHPETASNVIIACVVLHNICIKNNIALEDDDILQPEDQLPQIIPSTEFENTSNDILFNETRRIQQQLISLCFS